MKLRYSSSELTAILAADTIQHNPEQICTHVVYDSRKINNPEGALFFALEGIRDGHDFVAHAYEQGVRQFVVTSDFKPDSTPGASFFVVQNTLKALQLLATHHRKRFSIPVIAITGSIGKTTMKEWIAHCISDRFKVVRSPKSFNSQIGVALSLLEIHDQASIALIEAGISKPGEMDNLREMIQPDYGIFTHFGTAHRENFPDKEAHLLEKWKLFSSCKLVWIPESFEPLADRLPGNFQICKSHALPQFSAGYSGMLGELASILKFLQYDDTTVEQKLRSLPSLALRMEVFDGIQGNTIINDTYNLDVDALQEALLYQRNLAGNRKRVLLLGFSENTLYLQNALVEIAQQFTPIEIHTYLPGETIDWTSFSDSVVLVKASRDRAFEQEVIRGKALKHRTVVEVNLSAIQHNLNYYREHLPTGTRMLCMVKAWAYGTGAERIASFLQQAGIDYLGVAFADEGVQLRKAGISLPIVVMNPDPEYSDLIIDYQLEPAIYDFGQLDLFITALLHRQLHDYPVHLKFDTGMHRLGFAPGDKEKVLTVFQSQPEVTIKGIYSHLADADNEEHQSFSLHQLDLFDEIVHFFRQRINQPLLAHILNSEGALRFPDRCHDMIRLGISMYGYTENKELKKALRPSIHWTSAVSQVKSVPQGDHIGYGCSYEAVSDMKIAIIPVGYADGFRRNLSNGVGTVSIRGKKYPVVGRVCMDMIMVDVSELAIEANEPVEIIGETIHMEDFAKAMQTIPYEVLTGLSKRMHRNYISE